jgi:hypothetical protein
LWEFWNFFSVLNFQLDKKQHPCHAKEKRNAGEGKVALGKMASISFNDYHSIALLIEIQPMLLTTPLPYVIVRTAIILEVFWSLGFKICSQSNQASH